MAVTTYANLRNNVQSVVYNIINSDTTVRSLCTHIVDGALVKVARERGFPYIVVNTPTIDEYTNDRISNSKFRQEVTVRVSIASIKESAVRQVADAVINALKSNQTTTRAANLNWFKLRNASLRNFMMENGDTVHVYDADVGYTFVG